MGLGRSARSPDPARVSEPRKESPNGGEASAGVSPAAARGSASGSLIARAKNILLSPSTEWPVYLGYVAALAAIGVVATDLAKLASLAKT
jgi:hypothetical protein